MKLDSLSLVLICSLLFSCAGPRVLPFQQKDVPIKPDYSDPKNWAALPMKHDMADSTPGNLVDRQDLAEVDVFFVHPTTFTQKKRRNQWNASLEDHSLNKKTDESSILYQASVFNGIGKVYAPRYRQAHINAYYTRDNASAKKAFEIAYQDVKASFEYYIENYNEGHPFIIAAHSQGTQHSGILIRDVIEGSELQDQLIVAYLIGMPAPADFFKELSICASPEETSCYCSWRSFRRGYYPPSYNPDEEIAINNPLSWTTDTLPVPRSLNQGAVLKNFRKVRKGAVDAQIHEGLLWMDRPKFPLSFLITTKNYHIGDYNLFYVNIRNNAILRSKSYLHKKSEMDK